MTALIGRVNIMGQGETNMSNMMTRAKLARRIVRALGPVDLHRSAYGVGFWFTDRDTAAAAAILRGALPGCRIEADRRRVFVWS